MPSRRFRIVSSTLALIREGDRHVARMVPSGSIITLPAITILTPGTDGDKLIEVQWESEIVMMFAQDLKARAEPIAEPPPSRAAAPQA